MSQVRGGWGVGKGGGGSFRPANAKEGALDLKC